MLSASGSVHTCLGDHVMCLCYRNIQRTEKLSEQKLRTLIGRVLSRGKKFLCDDPYVTKPTELNLGYPGLLRSTCISTCKHYCYTHHEKCHRINGKQTLNEQHGRKPRPNYTANTTQTFHFKHDISHASSRQSSARGHSSNTP